MQRKDKRGGNEVQTNKMTSEVYTHQQFMRKYLPNDYVKKREDEREKIILETRGVKGLEKYRIEKAVDEIIGEIFKKVKLKSC